MESNDIYSFFRTRKNQFEEAPGHVIWSKIEAELNGTQNTSTSRQNFKKILFTAVALTFAVICILLYSPCSVEAPVTAPLQEQHFKEPVVSPGNAIKEPEHTFTEAAETTDINVVTDSVKKAKRVKKAKEAPPAFKPFTAIMAAEAAPRDTIPLDINNLPVRTKRAPNRIVVDTKFKLTAPQFKSLAARIIEENKDAAGTTIIVKAPGHKVFRTVIDTFTGNPQHIGFITDTLKNKPINKSIRIIKQPETLVPTKDNEENISPATNFRKIGNSNKE